MSSGDARAAPRGLEVSMSASESRPTALYGGQTNGRRVTVRDLAAAKEGGEKVLPQVEALVAAGIPVMAHLGLTPQSVNAFGGYRVQGRGESGERLMADAKALEAAGAFSLVLECVPAELAERVTNTLSIP